MLSHTLSSIKSVFEDVGIICWCFSLCTGLMSFKKFFFLLVLPTCCPVNICMHSALQTVAKGDFIDFLIFSSEAGGRRAGDCHGDGGAVQCGGRILVQH